MSVPGHLVALVALLAVQASAHGGHENVPQGEAVSADPIVSTPTVRI